MSNIPIIAATTAAVATAVEANASSYPVVAFAASGLAGAETVTIKVSVAGGLAQAVNTEGASANLTAALPMQYLPGGARYAITKSATVAASGVDMIVARHY